MTRSHYTDVSTVFMRLKINGYKRMHWNIFQHKQQNAVVNECCKHANVSAKELFRRMDMGKPLLCTLCIYYSYRHLQQHKDQVQGDFQGQVMMRRKLARIHLCKHFQQQTNYLYVYYKFSPYFWGPASHHWPSPDRKGKEDVGRKRRIKTVRLTVYLIFHSF